MYGAGTRCAGHFVIRVRVSAHPRGFGKTPKHPVAQHCTVASKGSGPSDLPCALRTAGNAGRCSGPRTAGSEPPSHCGVGTWDIIYRLKQHTSTSPKRALPRLSVVIAVWTHAGLCSARTACVRTDGGCGLPQAARPVRRCEPRKTFERGFGRILASESATARTGRVLDGHTPGAEHALYGSVRVWGVENIRNHVTDAHRGSERHTGVCLCIRGVERENPAACPGGRVTRRGSRWGASKGGLRLVHRNTG